MSIASTIWSSSLSYARRQRLEVNVKQEEISKIPIAEIVIANPRTRSRKKWIEIVTSVREVGLKRPITVSRRKEPTADGRHFDLVCGQGRIEAFLEAGKASNTAI